MTEWNDENIKEHMFTEVEVADGDERDWFPKKLIGFCIGRHSPFHAFDHDTGESLFWEKMRLIPVVEKPKSLRITEDEEQHARDSYGGGGRIDLIISKHNALVDLVEGKDE